MRYILLSVIFIVILTSCSTFDPEGIWQKSDTKHQQLLIVKIDNNLAVRSPEMKNWNTFKAIKENTFSNSKALQEITFKDNNTLTFTDQKSNRSFTFIKTIPDSIDKRILVPGLTPKQVQKFVGNPVSKNTSKQITKWIYPNRLQLTFHQDSLTSLNSNYIADRDFTKIKKKMTREEVIAILGNPDHQSPWNQKGQGFQQYFYDMDTLEFGNKFLRGAAGKILEINPDLIIHSAENNFYTLSDIINDKPIGFVIEDRYEEFLNCSCEVKDQQAWLLFEGEKSTLKVKISKDKSFEATRSYELIDQGITKTDLVFGLDIKLSTARHEIGNKLLGFIKLEEDCLLEKHGPVYPCYIKGTFECTFK